MAYVIGVDLGTSATKTILVDERGKVCSTAVSSYLMLQPKNGWAEQNPLDWKNAVLRTLKQVIVEGEVKANELKGIGLSGQMHGSVLIDSDDQPIGNTILWCDQRSDKQAEEMLDILPLEDWLSITANPPLAAWTAAKLLWIKENEPNKFEKCKRVLLPKDYIRLVLTGEHATDVSDASGMQLMDIKNRCWSDTVIDKLDLDKSLLGDLYESQDITGYLTPEILSELGLEGKVPVVAGGSDNACAAIGTGIVNEGQAFVTLGTSSVVFSHFDKYISIPDGGLHVCCAAVPNGWHSMGGPMSAGMSVEWFKDEFCQDLIMEAESKKISFYDLMTDMTSKVPIGSEKLIFMPFLMGERTPHFDSDYRGAFLGLNTIHGQEHMLRAIMEGVVYCLADCNDLLKDQGVIVNSLRVVGGGSSSIVYRELLANLFECDIHRIKSEEGAAYGAAILAGVGSGLFSSVHEASEAFVENKDTVTYVQEDVEEYKKYHKVYNKMYYALKESYKELANI